MESGQIMIMIISIIMIMIISIMMIFLKNDHLVIMSRMALIENKFAFSIIRLINFHMISATPAY